MSPWLRGPYYIGVSSVIVVAIIGATVVVSDGHGELDELAGDGLDAELEHLLAEQRPGQRPPLAARRG